MHPQSHQDRHCLLFAPSLMHCKIRLVVPFFNILCSPLPQKCTTLDPRIWHHLMMHVVTWHRSSGSLTLHMLRVAHPLSAKIDKDSTWPILQNLFHQWFQICPFLVSVISRMSLWMILPQPANVDLPGLRGYKRKSKECADADACCSSATPDRYGM